jgi:hypothetical protein
VNHLHVGSSQHPATYRSPCAQQHPGWVIADAADRHAGRHDLHFVPPPPGG